MRVIFEQSERSGQEIVYVYMNTYNEVFIGNIHEENGSLIVFDPDEAILFAKEVMKLAKKAKSQIK